MAIRCCTQLRQVITTQIFLSISILSLAQEVLPGFEHAVESNIAESQHYTQLRRIYSNEGSSRCAQLHFINKMTVWALHMPHPVHSKQVEDV